MLERLPIAIYPTWKDHERKNQPQKERLTLKGETAGLVNHFLYDTVLN